MKTDPPRGQLVLRHLAPISSLWPNLPRIHLDPKGYFLSPDPDLEHWGLAGVNYGEHMQQGLSSAGLR